MTTQQPKSEQANAKPNYQKIYDDKELALEEVKSKFLEDLFLSHEQEEALQELINGAHGLGCYSRQPYIDKLESQIKAIEEKTAPILAFANIDLETSIADKVYFAVNGHLSDEEKLQLQEVQEKEHVANDALVRQEVIEFLKEQGYYDLIFNYLANLNSNLSESEIEAEISDRASDLFAFTFQGLFAHLLKQK